MIRRGGKKDFLPCVLLLLSIALSAACTRNAGTPTAQAARPEPTEVSQSDPAIGLSNTPTASPSPAASPTPSPEPTASRVPTETSTSSPSATAAPQTYILIVSGASSAFIRSGPGEAYPALAVYTLGLPLEAIGRNEAADWFAVDLGLEQIGWILASLTTYELDPDHLAVLSAPPPPPPTATPAALPSVSIWVNEEARKLIISYQNFTPEGEFTVEIIRADGSQALFRIYTANESGNGQRTFDFQFIPSGQILVIVTGPDGGTWQAAVTINK